MWEAVSLPKNSKKFIYLRTVSRRLKFLSRKFCRRPDAVEIYCEWAAAEVYAKNFSRTVLQP